ncbi:MAG TPA: ATPase F0F1 [Chromatiales bacterium]|nr:ATPase F0F1 [Chromatiales bacterium]
MKDDPQRMSREVERKAARRLQSRRAGERDLWFWLGMFGMVGWSVAIPTLAGIAIGLWADRHWPGGPSWSLTGLTLGILLGCLNAWYWVRREGRHEQ